MIGKVTLPAPGSTTALAGTRATAGLLLVRVRATPPGPAAWGRVTCPRASRPPGTGLGKRARARATSVGGGGWPGTGLSGRSWSEATAVPPGGRALIVTVVVAVTGEVVTGKEAIAAPGGTVTEAGTEAAGELLERRIITPSGPAGQGIVTWPVVGWPPITGLGWMTTCADPIGRTARPARWAVPL